MDSGAFVRGSLDLCLLAALSDGEAYGYLLIERLEDAGLPRLAGGTLYPALLRLERAGHLTSQWRPGDGGPGRKYYALTSSGREALRQGAAGWRDFSRSVERLLDAASVGGPSPARAHDPR